MGLVNCFSTLGCPQLTLRQAVQVAQIHGIPMVEVRTVSGSTDLPATLGIEFGRPEELANYLARANTTVPVIGSSHRLFGETFDFRELKELALWANAAGARFIRVFDGDCETLDDEKLDLAEARFDQWETERAALGIKVQFLVETHGVLCSNFILKTFTDRFPEAAILWDTHHTWASGNALADTCEIIGRRLNHIHVKDSLLTEGKRQYVLPGKGAFPVGELVGLIGEVSPASVATSLEWEKHWHPELPVLELALERAAEWR